MPSRRMECQGGIEPPSPGLQPGASPLGHRHVKEGTRVELEGSHPACWFSRPVACRHALPSTWTEVAISYPSVPCPRSESNRQPPASEAGASTNWATEVQQAVKESNPASRGWSPLRPPTYDLHGPGGTRTLNLPGKNRMLCAIEPRTVKKRRRDSNPHHPG